MRLPAGNQEAVLALTRRESLTAREVSGVIDLLQGAGEEQAAFAYLAAHANPSFSFQCPGWADGHQAMTCVNVAGLCPGIDVIVIATPCPAAYENEAWNSNHIWTGPFDPYGSCSGSQAEAAGASPPTQSPGQESTTLAPLATGIPTQIASLRLIL